MTRAEQAAQQAARLRSKQEALAKRLARTEAVHRDEERKARDKRRHLVGKLVEDAGLFAWSNTDLKAVMQALAPLRDTPHPGEVLAGILYGIPSNGTEDNNQGKSRSHDSAFPLETLPEPAGTAPCL